MRWRVTGQAPKVTVGPNMTPVHGYDIMVQTDTGHADTVFVANADYTPEGVAAAVTARLAKVDEIAGLTGEV